MEAVSGQLEPTTPSASAGVLTAFDTATEGADSPAVRVMAGLGSLELVIVVVESNEQLPTAGADHHRTAVHTGLDAAVVDTSCLLGAQKEDYETYFFSFSQPCCTVVQCTMSGSYGCARAQVCQGTGALRISRGRGSGVHFYRQGSYKTRLVETKLAKIATLS